MADRKENELTKANNFAYVRALDSNGNSIQISKSDLVSVLEELLPLGYAEFKAISDRGLKITINENSASALIIDIFGNNSDGCGKCTLYLSFTNHIYYYEGKNPIRYLKKKTNGDNIDFYMYHNSVFLSYGAILNGNNNRSPNITIINSESEIPSDAIIISPS